MYDDSCCNWTNVSLQLNSECWVIQTRGRHSGDHGGLRWFAAAGQQWRAVVQPLEASRRRLGMLRTFRVRVVGACYCFYPVPCRKDCWKCCALLNLAVVVCAGSQHQPLGPALRCQHLEGRPAEQKEAFCGSLLSLLHTTELGNITLQLINSPMGSVDWDPKKSRLCLVIYFLKKLSYKGSRPNDLTQEVCNILLKCIRCGM